MPVSVNHTAMRDYILPSNSIVISSALRQFTPRLSKRYDQYGMSTYYVDGPDALRAFNSALDLDEAVYARLSDAARETVAEKFSPDILRSAIDTAVECAALDLMKKAECKA